MTATVRGCANVDSAILRSFWNYSAEAGLVVDGDGTVVSANRAATALLAVPEVSLIGQAVEALGLRDRRGQALRWADLCRDVGEADAGAATWEISLRARTGRCIESRLRVLNLQDPETGTLLILRPEVRRHADALQQMRAELDHVVNGTAEAVVSTDPHQRIVRFNAAAEAMFGYAPDEVLGQPIDLLIPEHLRERHKARMREFMSKPPQARWMNDRSEITGRRRDGSVFPAEATILKTKALGRTTYTAVVRDVSHRKEIETRLHEHVETLAAARREAEAANRAKSEFLASMSHELRTPLNAVIGFAETMSDELFGPLGNARYREYADDILHSAQHLLAILNDILDVSKAEVGRIDLHEGLVDFAEIVNSCERLIRGRLKDAELTLTVDLPPEPTIIYVDERVFKQVLINVLSNAVKFTPAPGRIWVTAERSANGGLLIRVGDTGIGIAPEDLERVFDAFTQADNTRTRAFEGTGLGLSLVRSLIELHGGRVWLTSELGAGTTVHMELPVHRVIEAEDLSMLSPGTGEEQGC